METPVYDPKRLTIDRHIGQLAANVQAFDAFEGDKMLVFYEDLMLDDGRMMTNLLEFLGVMAVIPPDMNAELRAKSLATYAGASMTNRFYGAGAVTDPLLHSKHLSKELRLALDKAAETQVGRLRFARCLRRYVEKP